MVLYEVYSFRSYFIMLSKNDMIFVFVRRVFVIQIYEEFNSLILLLIIALDRIGVIIFYLKIFMQFIENLLVVLTDINDAMNRFWKIFSSNLKERDKFKSVKFVFSVITSYRGQQRVNFSVELNFLFNEVQKFFLI